MKRFFLKISVIFIFLFQIIMSQTILDFLRIGISLKDLDAKEGVAYDKSTGQPYNGNAYLNFYDGTLRMKGAYIAGIKSGIWKYYIQGSTSRYYNLQFEDGNITSAEYKDSDKTWSGIPMLYSETDTTVRTGIFLIQQMSEGQKLYNFNSPPDIFIQMFKNVSEGKITRWHSNGEIYLDGQIINGNRTGEFNWYYDSGSKKERAFFDNNEKRIATTTQWYENGKKRGEANYKKGLLQGKLTLWYENGQKTREATFKDGDLISEECWDEDGNEKECIF